MTTDHKDLGCALAEEVEGKHCAFETQNKRNSKSSDSRSNANLLQPYTTTNNMHLLGAGLWMAPAMKAKLDKENWDRPSPRFAVSCKFAVEGIAKDLHVQWKPGEGWHRERNWHTGTLGDCTIAKP